MKEILEATLSEDKATKIPLPIMICYVTAGNLMVKIFMTRQGSQTPEYFLLQIIKTLFDINPDIFRVFKQVIISGV